eukprot:TRINITY_DN28808_c0_g1_i2.p1 TRINITY_DN28808_c0_g1~~TRINITY_DN28808_c0_g1_i2.p1  ORF type:complete len:221 (+),score=22.42 TRINITY_DN28808_c0_g1_i2:43-705(+)
MDPPETSYGTRLSYTFETEDSIGFVCGSEETVLPTHCQTEVSTSSSTETADSNVDDEPYQPVDTSWTIVECRRRQFLCEDALSKIKEFLPDKDLLRSRLTCQSWAAQDELAWKYVVEVMKEYKKDKPGSVWDVLVQSGVVAKEGLRKAGGVALVGTGIALGLGSIVGGFAILLSTNGACVEEDKTCGHAEALTWLKQRKNVTKGDGNGPETPPGVEGVGE